MTFMSRNVGFALTTGDWKNKNKRAKKATLISAGWLQN